MKLSTTVTIIMYRIIIAYSLLLPYSRRCSDAFGVVPPLPNPDIVFLVAQQPRVFTTSLPTFTISKIPNQFTLYQNAIRTLSLLPTTQMMTNTMNLADDSDYTLRAQQFGIASDESIREALQQSGTIVLDVRTTEEIVKTGRLVDSSTFPLDRLTYIQSDCTPTDCFTLRTSPEEVIPNLATSTSTIVVHCATGRRAALAKEFLTQYGYKGTILNAGSYNDVQRFFDQ